jgi:hypothetical protein
MITTVLQVKGTQYYWYELDWITGNSSKKGVLPKDRCWMYSMCVGSI